VKRKFLGYQNWYYGILLIAKRSIERFKDKVRTITKRNRGVSFETLIIELNKIIPGWVRYFKLAKCKNLLQSLDEWIRRKLRCYKLKQLKRTYTVVKALIAMGVREHKAWRLAKSGKGLWCKSNTPQAAMAMNLRWFENQGLKSLQKIYLSL
jgi:RNA-directed DNA polymerase